MTIYMLSVAPAYEKNQHEWPDFGERHFIGWYFNYDDAYETIEQNTWDIYNGVYTYAFIEPWDDGTYGSHISEDVDWFKWDDTLERYVPIPQPKIVGHFCGLTNLD